MNAAEHRKLAAAAAKAGRRDEAAQHYAQAITLEPDNADLHTDYGVLLHGQGKFEAARIQYEQAVRLKPNMVGHYNLGVALQALDRPSEAAARYRSALALEPRFAQGHFNLGVVLMELGELEAALDHYRKSLTLMPNQPDAHWNIALANLTAGKFTEGFAKYDWRWKRPGYKPRLFIQPLWDGRELGGKRILLYAEQGIGDMLNFVRYAPLVKARGGHVIVECHRGLGRLLKTAPGVDEVVTVGEGLPRCDFQLPMMDVPRVFGTTLETIPAGVPYLAAEPALVEKWRARLGAGPHVGLVWRGSPTHGNDRRRSMTAETAAKVCGPNVNWVSLQIDGRETEIAALEQRAARFMNLGPELTDWADTAALVSCLDLVVAVDTSVAHLAGALAKPVWVMVPYSPDWRWLLKRGDSPWYPTMRLFRQLKPVDWESVVQTVHDRIAAEFGG